MKKFILVILSAICFITPLVAYAANQPKGFPSRVTGRVVDGHYEEYSIYPWSIEYDEKSGKMTLLYQVETAYHTEPIFLYLVTINSKEKRFNHFFYGMKDQIPYYSKRRNKIYIKSQRDLSCSLGDAH